MSTDPPNLTTTIFPEIGDQREIHSGVPTESKRACNPCKRNKIRCDGGRPCISCLKEGYGPEQCVDGCRNCSRARLPCDGNKPCSSCLNARRHCFDLLDPGTLDSPGSAEVINHTIRTGERAKLACQACRRDNKKCDNDRPCSRCVARNEECIHVLKAGRVIKRRCQTCRINQSRCDNFRPCQLCIQIGIECVDVARKGSGLRSNVKRACVQCRLTKIQCDEHRPCRSCVRRGVQCRAHHEDDPKLSEESASERVHSVGQAYHEFQPNYSGQYHKLTVEGGPSNAGPSFPSTSAMTNEYSYAHLSGMPDTAPHEAYNFGASAESNWSTNDGTVSSETSYADFRETPSNLYVQSSVQEGGGLIGESSNTVYAHNTEALQSGQHEGGFLTQARAPAPMPVQELQAYDGLHCYYIDYQLYPEYHDTPPDESVP